MLLAGAIMGGEVSGSWQDQIIIY